MTDALLEGLARGLFDKDAHDWATCGDWESLRPAYVEQARRFLLPHVPVIATERVRAVLRLLSPDHISPLGRRQIERVLDGGA